MLRRAAIFASIALHLALFTIPALKRTTSALRQPLEVELVPRELRRVSIRSITSGARSRNRGVAAHRAAQSPPSASTAPIVPTVADEAAPVAPRDVNLFARDAIGRVVGSALIDRPEAEAPVAATKRRVDGWLGDDGRRADVAAGRVDPAYRVLERSLNDDFHPPAAVLKPHGWGGALRDEWKTFLLDPERGSAPPSRPVWLEAEVEVALDASGAPKAVRLSKSSGFSPFDRFALAEIDRVSARRHAALPHAATLTFRVRGSYVAKVPLNYYSFSFDARGVHGANPFGEVQSNVTLLAVHPEPSSP